MAASSDSSSSKWTKPLVLFLGSLVISWLALSYYPQLSSLSLSLPLSLSPSQPPPEESPATTTTTITEPEIHDTKNDEVDQAQQHEEEIPPDVGASESEGEAAAAEGEQDEVEDGSSPVPQSVILENNFETPVDLYWINKHNPDQVEYILIDSSIPKFSANSEHYLLGAKRHDEFVLKDPQTNEIVFEFQVGLPNVSGPGGDFFVVAEPPPSSSSVESDDDEDEEEDEEEYEGENGEQYEPEQADEGKAEEGEDRSDDNNSYEQSSDEL